MAPRRHDRATFADALTADRTAVITHLTTPSATIAEHLARAPYDGLVIDLQHGDLSMSQVLPLVHAIEVGGSTPLARIPLIDRGVIGRLLDYGVRGIIAPMVESREEVEALITATTYAPRGDRSYGPQRPDIYGAPADYPTGQGYAAVADAAITRIVQIETWAGLDAAEEIMSTPGLDAIYIGPTDLSRALGLEFGADWREGPVLEAIDRLLELGRTYGVGVGLYTLDADYAREQAAKGLAFVVLSGDIPLITGAARNSIERFTGDV